MKIYRIKFNTGGKSIKVVSGTNLLEAARLAGVSISSECGGQGSCGKCRVIVEGEVSSHKSIEIKTFTSSEVEEGFRLACCTCVLGDLRVRVPESSLLADVRLQLEGDMGGVKLNPGVLAYETHINGSVPIGFAVDLGTTKIAACLVNLATGKPMASAGMVNPQNAHGEDIMTRLRYAIRTREQGESQAPELTEIIRVSLNGLLETLIKKAGVSHHQITGVCIVGNSAMTHLLLNLPVKQLASTPYVCSSKSSFLIKAKELGLKTAAGALVYIPPAIGGFVGSDHIAMIIASDIDRAEKITLGIDIGTNTEIVIRKPGMDKLASLSCPSGPAFEGAHISEGMRASKGAIEMVKFTDTGIKCRTVGGTLPRGLCGSGVIDVIAELYRWRVIDERGRMQKSNERIRQGKEGLEFLLVPCSETVSNKDLVITQKDIDEILLAKGAIRAGIEILLEGTGTPVESVEEVVIAGAFGAYINLSNAVDIGMFPKFPNASYKQVGNAAMTGAQMVILSCDEQKRAEDIAKKTKPIELATTPGFNRKFAAGIMLPKLANDCHDKLFKEQL